MPSLTGYSNLLSSVTSASFRMASTVLPSRFTTLPLPMAVFTFFRRSGRATERPLWVTGQQSIARSRLSIVTCCQTQDTVFNAVAHHFVMLYHFVSRATDVLHPHSLTPRA